MREEKPDLPNPITEFPTNKRGQLLLLAEDLDNQVGLFIKTVALEWCCSQYDYCNGSDYRETYVRSTKS